MQIHFFRIITQSACVLLIMNIALIRGQAQSGGNSPSDNAPVVQKYDLRQEPAASAVVAGLSASRNGVVVVLVRGGDQQLINEVENNMKALMLNGFERIGLILGSSFSNESKPVISIFSQGQVYAVIEDAKADTDTKLAVFKLVRDSYTENVIPLLGKAKGDNN